MTWLTDPLSFDFIQQAMLTTAMIAAAAAVLSCFLVLKGWSLMGDAIAHAILPGVVLAYIAGLPLILGAFAAGMTCAAATGFLTENSRIKQDTVMGVVFAGMFGLGIVLYTGIETELHLDHILFGDMLGLGWADVAEAGAIAAMVAAGEREIAAVYVVAGSPMPVTPCGGCRQKLAEFAGPDVEVVMATVDGVEERMTMGALLPGVFTTAHMDGAT